MTRAPRRTNPELQALQRRVIRSEKLTDREILDVLGQAISANELCVEVRELCKLPISSHQFAKQIGRVDAALDIYEGNL
jgi:hypothetical protein